MNANGREWESFHHEDSKSTKERGGDWAGGFSRGTISLFGCAVSAELYRPAGRARRGGERKVSVVRW
jgi:hypothetical protein